MDHRSHDQTDHNIQNRDQKTGNRVALDEFRCAVERPEKCGFLQFPFAPRAGFGMSDGPRRHIAVDGQLFAGHPIKSKARTHFGHPGRTLGDHHEIDNQQDTKDDKPQKHAPTHDEIGKALNHVPGGVCPGVALANDQLGRTDVQRQPQHQRGQQDRWEGRKVQRAFNKKRDSEDQDRQRKRCGQPNIQDKRGDRQDHHHDHSHQRDGQDHGGFRKQGSHAVHQFVFPNVIKGCAPVASDRKTDPGRAVPTWANKGRVDP